MPAEFLTKATRRISAIKVKPCYFSRIKLYFGLLPNSVHKSAFINTQFLRGIIKQFLKLCLYMYNWLATQMYWEHKELSNSGYKSYKDTVKGMLIERWAVFLVFFFFLWDWANKLWDTPQYCIYESKLYPNRLESDFFGIRPWQDHVGYILYLFLANSFFLMFCEILFCVLYNGAFMFIKFIYGIAHIWIPHWIC